MTLGLVFVIGLVASVSSCMAITGGLLLALAAKYNEMAVGGAAQRFLPHLSFNAGRLVGYAGFGALTGLVGSALMISPEVSAALTIAASVLMLAIGLQMLGLLPPLTHLLRMPRSLQHRVHDLVASKSGVAAFALGAATFFLPCGFTLALQLYVLAQGSPLHGALTMFVFALGTLPALLSLSMLSSFVTGRMQGYFLKLAGAAVIMLGFLNIQYGLVQAGSGYTPVVPFSSAQTAAVAPAQARQVQIVDDDRGRPRIPPEPLHRESRHPGGMAHRRPRCRRLRAHPGRARHRRDQVPRRRQAGHRDVHAEADGRDRLQLQHGHDDPELRLHGGRVTIGLSEGQPMRRDQP